MREVECLLSNKGGLVNPFGPGFQFSTRPSITKQKFDYKQVWKEVYKYTQGESLAKGLPITDYIIQENLKKDIICHIKLLSNAKHLLFQDKEMFRDYLAEVFIDPLLPKAEWNNKVK